MTLSKHAMPAGTGLALQHRGEVAAELIQLHADVRSGVISPRDGRDLAILLRQLAKCIPHDAADMEHRKLTENLAASLNGRR